VKRWLILGALCALAPLRANGGPGIASQLEARKADIERELDRLNGSRNG
jgi:hypothetical protein